MNMATSYSVGKHFEAFIERLIAGGRYSTASEIIRDGLRMIEQREQSREAKLEALRAAIQEGLDSPSEEVDIDEMIEDVKRGGRERLAAERDGKQITATEAGQSLP